MDKRIFIAGATCRSAAESAVRAGFDVTAADLFGDRDLRRCAATSIIRDYPRGIEGIARHVPARYWMYTGGLENHARLVAIVSRHHFLLGNGPGVLRRVRDPGQLRSALSNADLPFPETRSETPPHGPASWLRKPRWSCGGMHVTKWKPGKLEKDDHFEAGGGQTNSYWYQRCIRGPVFGVLFIAGQGRAQLMGVTRLLAGCEWAGAGRYQYVGSIGPIELDRCYTVQLRRLGACLASEFSLCGLFGVDIVLQQGRPWTLEVNPRFTASVEVIERAASWGAVQSHVTACINGEIPSPLDAPRQLHGKAIVYATESGIARESFCNSLDRMNCGDRSTPPFADLPQPGTLVRSGQPILTVFAKGADPADVYRRLRTRAGWVRKQL